MRFGFHLFMVNPSEFPDIARTCDETLWDFLAVGDAPFYPEKVSAPYPYTKDGSRFWPLDSPVLDPWIAITQMATLTRRLRFLVSVLRMPIRKPLLEAKMACSVAAVANDRLAIGIGLAWMPEEFKFLNEDKKTRGARTDEAIQILRLCMGGGFVEFHGKYYDFDRLIMEPHPKTRVPIYVGGTVERAIRRAAQYGDGWLGITHRMEALKKIIPKINELRKEYGRDKEPFDIMVQCPDATTVDDIRRLEDIGVTDLWVAPWLVESITGEPVRPADTFLMQMPLQVKLDAIRRYSDEVISHFNF